MNIVLLMMGGRGTRFGADIPKQFVPIHDKPIFSYILKGLNDAQAVDSIIVVVHRDWIDCVREWAQKLHADKVYAIVSGGATRSESVRNGLDKASEIADEDAVIMMHDATHPYVDAPGIAALAEAAREYGGATMGQRQYDTCYRMDENDMLVEVVPRQYLVSGASPEAFRFREIYRIYQAASQSELEKMTSAGAIALANGIRMKVCTLNTLNLKITYKEDLALLQALMNTYFFPEEGKGN